MNRFKKLRAVWLGRLLDSDTYEVGDRKKDWDSKNGFGASYITFYFADEFERVTGIRLEPGEVRKVRIIVEDAE